MNCDFDYSSLDNVDNNASMSDAGNINDVSTSTPAVDEINTISEDDRTIVSQITDVANQDTKSDGFKLDIDQDILNGFNSTDNLEFKQDDIDDNDIKSSTFSDNSSLNQVDFNLEREQNPDVEETHNSILESNDVNDEVLDNAIAVMKKMIEETNKLNEKINNLEKEIEEKDRTIEKQESKKNELNSLLDQANEMLEKID